MMSVKQALEIIDVQDRGQHEYTLVCKTCGEPKTISTDSPNDLLIMMAEDHKKRHGIEEG
jgi:hypothetical protein